MIKRYDVAIIGAGVFGSWIAFHLQRAGWSVALIDAYGAGNSRASSGGESRIIRMGYGADEIYTRWAQRALVLWHEFFDGLKLNETLFHRTGVLWMARENDPYTLATAGTLEKVGIKFERLGRGELKHQYPEINFGNVTWAIYEPDSGVLMARRAVQAVAQETIRNGCEYFSEAVKRPAGSGHLTEIIARSGARISAGIFVFACGPWLPMIFPELLRDRINITRQEVLFFGIPAGDSRFTSPHMPTWIDFGAEIYGMPDLENRGFKIALDRHGPAFDPDSGERVVTEDILIHLRTFLAMRFPAMKDAPLVETRVCQYENTSNGDFLIDLHPDYDNVWLVGGGSGHGFKHGPRLGEYVAALIVEGGEVERRFTLATKNVVKRRTVF